MLWIMKAAPTIIPEEKSEEVVKNTQTNPVKGDNLWAAIRRNKAQIDALTQQVSTLRRDYNRLNSKYYREENKVQPDQKPVSDIDKLLKSGLFS